VSLPEIESRAIDVIVSNEISADIEKKGFGIPQSNVAG
jgi:hypothetical protein